MRDWIYNPLQKLILFSVTSGFQIHTAHVCLNSKQDPIGFISNMILSDSISNTGAYSAQWHQWKNMNAWANSRWSCALWLFVDTIIYWGKIWDFFGQTKLGELSDFYWDRGAGKRLCPDSICKAALLHDAPQKHVWGSISNLRQTLPTLNLEHKECLQIMMRLRNRLFFICESCCRCVNISTFSGMTGHRSIILANCQVK